MSARVPVRLPAEVRHRRVRATAVSGVARNPLHARPVPLVELAQSEAGRARPTTGPKACSRLALGLACPLLPIHSKPTRGTAPSAPHPQSRSPSSSTGEHFGRRSCLKSDVIATMMTMREVSRSRSRLASARAVTALALLLGTGCGGRSGSHTSVGPTGAESGANLPGYMAKNSLGVAFIQWQRNQERLTGTISEAGFDRSDRTQFVSEHHDFVGTIVGSDVGLALDNGSRWNGTLRGTISPSVTPPATDRCWPSISTPPAPLTTTPRSPCSRAVDVRKRPGGEPNA